MINLQQTIDLIYGGGPGSGRHPEHLQSIADAHPKYGGAFADAKSSLDIAKITRMFHKELDDDDIDDDKKITPGAFQALKDYHSERVKSGNVKMDTRTPQERQADRIGSYLTDVNRSKKLR